MISAVCAISAARSNIGTDSPKKTICGRSSDPSGAVASSRCSHPSIGTISPESRDETQVGQLTVQMRHPRRSGALVKVIDVLRQHLDLEIPLQLRDGPMPGVRLGGEHLAAAFVVKFDSRWRGCAPRLRACRHPRYGSRPTGRPNRGTWQGRCRRSPRRPLKTTILFIN